MHVHGKILHVSPETGMMDIIGINHDIRLEVSLTQGCGAGQDFWGDFSMPSRGWHVLLVRVGSDEYWPIRYRRPFSEKEGWSHPGFQDAQPGDFLYQGSELGGRIFASQSGMIELSSAPNAYFHLHPLEDGERGELVARDFSISTEHGEISLEKDQDATIGGISLTGYFSRGERKTYSRAELGTITFEGKEAKGFSISASNEVSEVAQIVGIQEELFLLGKKITLAKSSGIQPAVRGDDLEQRLSAIEEKINQIVQGFLLHTHAAPGAPITVVPPTATPTVYIKPPGKILSDQVFLP